MLRLVLLIILSAAIVSCRTNSGFSEEEKQSVRDSVTRTLHNYYEDISRNGLLAEFNYLDSSENFFWVPPGYTQAIAFDSTARFIRKNAPLIRNIRIRWETLRVIPLTKDLATYTGKLASVSTNTAGKTSYVSLVETGLLIKRSSGWKLLGGQTSVVN